MTAQVLSFPGPAQAEPLPEPTATVAIGDVLAALQTHGALTAAEAARACNCRQRPAEQALKALVRLGLAYSIHDRIGTVWAPGQPRVGAFKLAMASLGLGLLLGS